MSDSGGSPDTPKQAQAAGSTDHKPIDTTPRQDAAVASTEQDLGDSAIDPKKEELEVQKLALEIRSLRFKQSPFGRIIELLQVILPLAALVSLVWTVSVGLRQQQQQSRDAESAQFEHAYTKLGSQLPSERATGVTQLSALLHLAGGIRDKEVLTALANQLALDADPAVRSAILNVFLNLDRQIGKDALDAALRSVVDLQSVIVQSSGLTPFELETALLDDRGLYFIPEEKNATPSIDPGSQQEALVRLASLKAAFLAFLKAGGRTLNMNHIFCPSCDFQSLGIDFSNASFQGAILPWTRWGGLKLERASFRNALIEGADFTRAHLQGADFSDENMSRQEFVETHALRNNNPTLPPALYLYEYSTGTPQFACADLRDASFKNYPLLVRLDEPRLKEAPGAKVRAVTDRDSWPRVFQEADIAGADFQEVRVIVLRRVEPKKAGAADEGAGAYESVHSVLTPPGYRYRYYAWSISVSYLKYYRPGRNASADRERDGDVEALALSLVHTRNYEQAKLPPGIVSAIKDAATRSLFRATGCAAPPAPARSQ